MDLAVLFSGGKDSNYALYWALNQGFNVTTLVSVAPERDDSFMFHKPFIGLTGLQAESIGIPLFQERVSGVKEAEVAELERIVSRIRVDGLVSGALASEYQKTRIDSLCERLSLKSFSPLWHKSQARLLEDMINAGFEIMVVGVAAEGLDESWLGRTLSLEDVGELKRLEAKYGISVAGEGGEYESFVVDGPTYRRRILVEGCVPRMSSRNSGFLEVGRARLA